MAASILLGDSKSLGTLGNVNLPAGDDRLLTIITGGFGVNAGPPSAVSYGGKAATLVSSFTGVIGSTPARMSMWYITEAQLGTLVDGNPYGWVHTGQSSGVFAYVFHAGVDQTTYYNDFVLSEFAGDVQPHSANLTATTTNDTLHFMGYSANNRMGTGAISNVTETAHAGNAVSHYGAHAVSPGAADFQLSHDTAPSSNSIGYGAISVAGIVPITNFRYPRRRVWPRPSA